MHRSTYQATPDTDEFSRSITSLLPACETETVQLADGDRLNLRIAPVAKTIGAAVVRMLAYNGSIPGPTLVVRQGSEVEVSVINDGDVEATVHWHGLRLENRYDGTHQTQEPIPVGGSRPSRVTFPDAGIYWYHPHIREDYGQEMGLYGNVLVVPNDPDYWPAVHREIPLTLDDILIEEGQVAPFRRSETTHAAMGRFGNVLLVSGKPDLALTAQVGEVVRFHLTNTANARVFRVRLPGARMKLVGGDSGRVEHEEFVDDIVIAPSERAIVDVRFDKPGQLTLEHRTPERTYPLAAIAVSGDPVTSPPAKQFPILRTDPALTVERRRVDQELERAPDKTLAFVAEMDMGEPELAPGATLVYACPMHPDVIRQVPGHCPKCGMKLLATEAPPDDHRSHTKADHEPGPHQHHGGSTEGIEWEDDMVEVNKTTTPANMHWKLVDLATGNDNTAIDWQFRVGDRVKIRLVNEKDSDHPMHHPFHIHGAGRFLILSRNGVVESNLIWSDTVLVRLGETVDILLDVTNPGLWMAHCHIAEHHESGMMFSFTVTA